MRITLFHRLLVAALALCAMTALAVALVPGFRAVGQPLAPWVVHNKLAESWSASGEILIGQDGAINLRNQNPKRSTTLWVPIKVPASHLLLVEGQFSLRDVVGGERPWQQARCFLQARTVDGKWRWRFPGLVFRETGTKGPFTARLEARIPDEITEVRLVVTLSRATGKLIVHSLSVREAETNPARQWVTWGLAILWFALGAGVVLPLWRGPAPISTLLFVGLLTTLLLMPEVTKQALSHQITAGARQLIAQFQHTETKAKPSESTSKPTNPKKPVSAQSTPEITSISWSDNDSHFFLFGLLAGWLVWMRRGAHLVQVATGMLIYGGSMELLQHFSPGRTPSWSDLGLDALGTMVGVSLTAGLYSLSQLRQTSR